MFAGGCDLATAEVVCADDSLAADELEDIIHALVDKSLVVAEHRGTELRFTQLQTLAHYGREKLAERGKAEQTRDAMAAHYARLCSGSAAAYTGAHQHAWLAAIDQEHDNLRAALEWAVAGNDAETALRIAGGASWTHWMTGTFTEGKRWIDEAFACAASGARAVDESTRALALMGRGLMNFLSGLPADSDADLAEALAVFRGRNEVDALALTYSFWAEFPHVFGDIAEARRRRVEVLAFYEGLPDDAFSIAARAYSAAMLGIFDSDLVAAEARYREAAAGFADGDRPVMRTVCLGMIADFDERAGRYPAAIEELDEAVELTDSLGPTELQRVTALTPCVGAAPEQRRDARRDRQPAGARGRPPAAKRFGALPRADRRRAAASTARTQRRSCRSRDRGPRAVPRGLAAPIRQSDRSGARDPFRRGGLLRGARRRRRRGGR